MEEIHEQRFTGERAAFMSCNKHFVHCIFAEGESPLKESHSLIIEDSSFQWKYPLWYSSDVRVQNTSFFTMARAGIWYTKHISLEDCLYEAPKGFRKAEDVTLRNVDFSDAQETLWNCTGVKMENVSARGDYFSLGSSEIEVKSLRLSGNYSFDGCKNVRVEKSKLLSKDAFWNCENVIVKDSFISGEYIGWNSKNITFQNCTIESLQGFCYIENLVLQNCRLLNTNLAFEYSTVQAEVSTTIESIKNPLGGTIKCPHINEVIFDDTAIDKSKTKIEYIGN